MKTLIIVAGFATLVGLAAFSTVFVGTETVVKNERVVETVVETVEVKDLEVRIKEAQEARHDAIEAEVDTYRQQLLEEVADEVKLEYIKEIESTISSESY